MLYPEGVFITNFNDQAAQTHYQLLQQRRQQQLLENGVVVGKPQSTQAGTLYIADTFESSPAELSPSHGQQVRSAALSTGYRGPIELRDFPRARYVMHDPSTPPQSAGDAYLDKLRKDTAASYQEVLRPATDQLQELTEAGAHHSVLNLSRGANPFDLVAIAYFQIQSDASLRGAAAEAFGLDERQLADADSKEAEPERARLQQALLSAVQQTVHTSPAIQEARRDYAQAVERFTSQHNSVVVAGGNSGTPLKLLEQEAGQTPQADSAAFRSALEAPGVVVVGATSGEGSTQPADYSRVHSNNQIYANGEVAGESGSSFAAPRVGVALAALHARHPEKSSQELLGILKEEFTLSGQHGQPPVLDAKALRQALESDTLQGAQDGWLLHS